MIYTARMRLRLTLLAIGFIGMTGAAIAIGVHEVLSAPTGIVVARVVDGDTLKVRFPDGHEDTVRVIGIDTPETVDPRKPVQCFGHEASNHTKALLTGKTVTLDSEPGTDRDKYGRLLRYVEYDGEDIGADMITEGYAFSYKIFPHPRLTEYNTLEETARAEKKGLWGTCKVQTDGEYEQSQ